MSLRNQTFSAVRWTTASAVFHGVLRFAQIAILARLLAPEHYGLMAMVLVILGFGTIFSDFGVNSAYVQRQAVTPVERSSLFWLNIFLSVAVTLVVVAISPLLAGFFGDEQLKYPIILAATTFVVAALGQQLRMTAEKNLLFRPVALIESVAAVIGFIAAVFAAYAGWGVYALILGSLVTVFVGTLCFWVFLAQGWRPLWRFRFSDVRSYLGFGAALFGNNIVNQIHRDVDLLLGGRMLAASALGLYSLPRQVVLQIQLLINPIITRVGFPLIAKVQNDIPRVRSIYLKTVNMTAAINAPMYIGIAFFAPEVVKIIFGPQWHESADLLRVLAVWGFLRSLGNPLGSLLFGMGRADLALKWNFGLLFIVPPVLWLGASFGLMGLAWSLLALAVAQFIPVWFVLIRPLCQASLREFTVVALRPLFISIVSIGPAFLVTQSMESTILRLLATVVVSAPLYVAISYKINREWVDSLYMLVAPKQA